MPPRKSNNIDLLKLNLPTSEDIKAHTVVIGRVANAMESIARGITSKEDVGPTIITNPLPDRYEPNKNTAFKIAATLGGTSKKEPFHIQLQQPVIKKMPGTDFLVPANQIISSLNNIPINGVAEYRVRGMEKGNIIPNFIIEKEEDQHREAFNQEFQILPKGMKITENTGLHKGKQRISWNSQEELADTINDMLKLIQKILNNPIIKPEEFYRDRPTITLMDISSDSAVREAYKLLSVDRTRKITDFTPEFGASVIQTLDNLLGYLQGNVYKNKNDFHGVKTEDILIEAVYTKVNKKMMNNFIKNLTFPCDLQSLRTPNFLLKSTQKHDHYVSDIYAAIYTKAIQSGLQPKMTNGDIIENFDVKNAKHFLGLIKCIVHTNVTDSQIKQRFKYTVSGLYQLIPRIPQPSRKKPHKWED